MANDFLGKAIKRLLKKRHGKVSYSQCGEDAIIYFLLRLLSIKRPYYLDIGAYDPFHFSNTAMLYEHGGRGLCVEPNPHLFDRIRRHRHRDTCINAGIGLSSVDKAPFYVMSTPTLSTFSKEEAERYVSFGKQKIESVIDVQLISINQLLSEYCEKIPDFVSIDVEGLDLEILQSLDFKRFRPAVFCVETLVYTENASESKIVEIEQLMRDNDYLIYADTYQNTIFVEGNLWRLRKMRAGK